MNLLISTEIVQVNDATARVQTKKPAMPLINGKMCYTLHGCFVYGYTMGDFGNPVDSLVLAQNLDTACDRYGRTTTMLERTSSFYKRWLNDISGLFW